MKRICSRIMMTVAALVVLIGMTVSAASDAPAKVTGTPTWQDVWNVHEYLGNNLYCLFDEEALWVEEDVENALTHAPKGQKIISQTLMDTFDRYSAIIDDDSLEISGEDELDETRAAAYSAWYDAAMAAVDGIITAPEDGKYYNDDLWAHWETMWNDFSTIFGNEEENIVGLIDENNSDGYQVVSSEDEAAEAGYENWILEEDIDRFFEVANKALDWNDEQDWDADPNEILRSELIAALNTMYEAFAIMENSNLGEAFTSQLRTDYNPADYVNNSSSAAPSASRPSHSPSSSSSHVHNYELKVIEEATADADAIVSMVCTICGQESSHIAAQGTAAGKFIKDTVSKIEKAPANGSITIDTNIWTCFNKAVINALKVRQDVTVTVNFKYRGTKHTFTVPANYGTEQLEALLDKNGYCGFMYLLTVFKGE